MELATFIKPGNSWQYPSGYGWSQIFIASSDGCIKAYPFYRADLKMEYHLYVVKVKNISPDYVVGLEIRFLQINENRMHVLFKGDLESAKSFFAKIKRFYNLKIDYNYT